MLYQLCCSCCSCCDLYPNTFVEMLSNASHHDGHRTSVPRPVLTMGTGPPSQDQ